MASQLTMLQFLTHLLPLWLPPYHSLVNVWLAEPRLRPAQPLPNLVELLIYYYIYIMQSDASRFVTRKRADASSRTAWSSNIVRVARWYQRNNTIANFLAKLLPPLADCTVWVYGYGQTARGARRNSSRGRLYVRPCGKFRCASGFAKPNVIAADADKYILRMAELLCY